MCAMYHKILKSDWLCPPIHYLVCNFFLISGADKEQVQEGDNQVRLGRMLPLLQDISSFVTRAYEVVKNVIQQLASLHSK